MFIPVRMRPVVFGWLLLCTAFSLPGLDTPSVVDGSFDPGLGADNDLFSVAIQSDGRILVAGQFATFNGATRSRIARLNVDGSLDLSFDPGTGADADVYALAVQPDGRVILAGAFTTVNGVASRYVARLHTNGTVDTSFNPGASVNNELRAVAMQPDGKVLIAGRFTSVSSQSRGRIARLNADGSLDTDFNPGTGADNNVRTMRLQTDGRILIGGQFTSFNGVARGRIARLMSDGSLDLSFEPGAGTDDQVRTIEFATDGMIYIGGDFETYNGTNRSAVARLFPNGGLDLAFDQGDSSGDTVRALAIQPEGRVWIGGLFAEAGGSSRLNIARLLPDGTADDLYPSGTGANDEVFALVLQPDGNLLAAGKFTSFDGTRRRRIIRLFGDPTVNSLEFSATNYTAAEPAGSARLTVIRHGDSRRVASVDVVLAPGTATPGDDYLPETLHLNFAPGEVEKTVSIPIIADHQDEPAETVALQLANFSPGAVAGVRFRAQLSVVDSGGVVAWRDGELPVSEAAGWARVVATRSGDLSAEVLVPYATIQGTAREGVDYQATSGWLPFPSGQDIAYADIPVFNDTVQTSNRTFFVRFGAPINGATLNGPIDLPVTIVDSEIGFVFRWPFYPATESIAIATITVDKLWDAVNAASVRYRTVGGTASPGVDYVPQEGVLTFAPGEVTKTFDVLMLNDGLADNAEIVGLQLYEAQGEVPLGPLTDATVTIYDSNDLGIDFVSTSYPVAESAGTVELQVRRLDDSTNTFTVHYGTVEGSARADRDYVAQSGALTLPPGGTSAIQIQLINDRNIGPDRAFSVVLIDPGPGASLGRATTAVVRMLDEQRPGSLDLGFASRLLYPDGLGGQKGALLAQSDGKVVFGDWQRVIRIFPDGAIDPGFAADYIRFGFDGPAFAQQADGRILVGIESGSTVSVFQGNSVIRLGTNGSIDPVFGRFATWGWTRVVLVQPDQKVIIGGNYVEDVLTPSFPLNNALVRLDADGIVDSTFNAGTFLPEGSVFVLPDLGDLVLSHLVETVVAQPDGKLVVGGVFTNVAGTACDRVVRLNPDGSIDPQFALHADLAPNRAATVAQIVLQPDGKLILAGVFTNLLGAAGNHLLRLHADGTVDSSFQSPLESDGYVECIALQPDSRLLAGGLGSAASGRYGPHFVIRLNADGSLDSTFDAGLSADRRVTDLVLLPGGDIVVAGEFATFNGAPSSLLAKLRGDALRIAVVARSPSGLDLVVHNARPERPVVLLSSSNLEAWVAVQTNTPVGTTARFTVTDVTRAAVRFYRASQ